MEKKIEKKLGSCDLEVVPLAIWWYAGKERNWRIFDDKASSIQNFKFYFLGTLSSWSQVINGGPKMSLLDFVDKTLHESLRAWWFLYLPFCVYVSAPWRLIYLAYLITFQKKSRGDLQGSVSRSMWASLV